MVKAGQQLAKVDTQQLQNQVTQAETNLQTAQTNLQKLENGATPQARAAAQAAYNSALANYQQVAAGVTGAALQADQSAVARAQATLASAQANYAKVQAGPLPTDVAQAQSAVDQAKATLSSAQAKLDEDNVGPKAADVAAAKSTLAQAQANLAATAGPPLTTDVALDQQQIKQAQAALDQAKVNLANATLTAPFAGRIAAVNANVGEQVGNTPIITLEDPSALRVDATVDETDMAKLAVGQVATITFDALPGTTLSGKVIAISPSGTATQGVVSYLDSVSVTNPPQDLKAGMSATVSIQTQRKDNVLLLPLRAVSTRGQTHTVEVLPANKGTKPEVKQVAIPTTSIAQPRVNVGGGGFGGGFGGPGGR